MFLAAVLTVLLSIVSGQIRGLEDPCQPQGHTVLKQPYRNTGYDTRPTDTSVCDNKLKRGWYRFADSDDTAIEIPTTCPGRNTCGTVTPVWIDGSHPQVKDDIVVRTLCGKVNDDPNGSCCDYKDELFVKNCKTFYVYYLNPLFDCPIGYCAGTAKRCPVGKWSATNFEPCRGPAPELDTPPVIKGPNVRANQSFDFQCVIQYGPKDPDQAFEVVWTFNNKPDPSIKPEVLTGAQRVATLSGDKLRNHLDTEVGCQVSTYYVPEKDRNTYQSKTIFFGVQASQLTGPNLKGTKSFNFQCDVTFASNDPDQQIEVVWTFDDKEDPKIQPQILTGQERQATLDGKALGDHLNSNIGCQARLIYNGYSIKTEFRKSNTYFAGIRVNPGRLEISDSEGEKDITITSTIPVVCNNGPSCCLTFRMNIDKNTVVSLKDSCDYKICSSDWDPVKNEASIKVTIVPSRNAIAGVNREAVLSFEELVISGSGPYLDIFKGHKPNAVQVVVKLEARFKCAMTGDPHFYPFDCPIPFHLYQTGDYTVYAVKDRDFLVQIRTWPCWAVTCICGIVVKEKNDIIKVYGCDKPNLTLLTIGVPYKLSEGTVVERSPNGQHIGILLSSGSELKIDITRIHMSVYIETPAYDKNKARGVCGTNDGKPENDFTHPNGTVRPVCTNPAARIPVEFTESWRVTGPDSMFEVAPQQVEEKPSTQYCLCVINSKGKSETICSPRQHIQETNLACNNCPDITKSLEPVPWGQPGQEQKPFEHKPVKPVDPNKTWPNDQGVTEAQAKELCSKAIQKSQLYPRCQNVGTLVANAMTECLGDVLHGGTTAALDAVTSSFTSNCQLTLAKDEKNYKPGPNGVLTLNPEINDFICPVECSDHGQCGQDGKCVCQKGWEGETCQIEKGKGPQINYASGGPECNTKQRSCDSIDFDKSNVNIHDKLKCRVQSVDNQGRKIGLPVIVDASGASSPRVICPLPKKRTPPQNYIISVTADGTTFGNELPVSIIDTC